MLSKKQAELLDVVARLGNFTTAAEHLNKVPSAVSYSIRQIEQELDVVLFKRLPRSVELTEAGRIYIEYARQSLAQDEQTKAEVRRVARGWQGSLKLTLDNVVKLDKLQPLIEDYYAQFPFAELQINMEAFNGSWEALSQQRADVVIGATSAVPIGGEFGIKPMGSLEWKLVCATMHPLAAIDELNVEHLTQYPNISLDDTSRVLPKRHQPLDKKQRRLLLPNWYTAIQCLTQSVGIGYLPSHIAAPLIEKGILVEKKVQQPLLASECCLVWRKDHSNKLIQWIVDYLGDPSVLEQDWIR